MSLKKILSITVLVSIIFLVLSLTSGILCLVFTAVEFHQVAELLTGLLVFFATTWGLLVISIVYLLACDRLGCCSDSCSQEDGNCDSKTMF